jgi:tetraacyldisaccharide-1-P 4'-kinase
LLRSTDVLLAHGSLTALKEVAIPAKRWTFERRPSFLGLPGGAQAGLDLLAGKRVGLLTTVARPQRLRDQLESRGIRVHSWRAGADHGALKQRPPRARERDVDVWLTTAKCYERIGEVFENIPVWVLFEQVVLPEPLVDLAHDKSMIRRQ